MVLSLRQLSGRLVVQRADGTRAIHFIAGRPIHMTSTLPLESMDETLQSSGAVARTKIRWMKERLTEGEDLEQSLIMFGALDEEKIVEHRRYRVRRAVSAGLLDTGASWSFEASPRLDGQRIHPDLIPDFQPLGALLEGSKQQVDINKVLMSLSEGEGVKLLPTADFDACFALLDVPGDLRALPEALRASDDFEDLFRRLSVEVAPLVQLLWVLDSAGVISRSPASEPKPCPIEEKVVEAWTARPAFLPLMPDFETGAEEATTPRQKARMGSRARSASSRDSLTGASGGRSASGKAAQTRSTTKAASSGGSGSDTGRTRKSTRNRPTRSRDRGTGRVSRRAVLRMVEGDHEHRMGRGPFAFLGVPADADDDTVSGAAAMLSRRWRQAEQDRSLPEDARSKAGELHAGVALAKKLIGDARSRELYELRRDTKGALLITASGLKEGPTPSARSGAAGGSRGGSSGGGNTALDRARALMADGEFRPALALLEEAREEEPSSPEVLAALGWATWKAHGARSASDAEEYLLLALVFDERSAAAVASLARIYLAQSNEQKARIFLKRLLRLESDATWAKRALSELGAPPSGEDGAAR